jgi:hypothetical protein
MLPVLPTSSSSGSQSEVDLIDQVRGFQGMAFVLSLHQVVRQKPQVGEDSLKEFILRIAISYAPSMQALCNISGGLR